MVLTKKDLDEALELQTERFVQIIEDKITAVFARVSLLEETTLNNQRKFEMQEVKLNELETANSELRSNIDVLSAKLEDLVSVQNQPPTFDFNKQLKAVEERLEERTNRSLRQTLVFKGIREKNNETWEDTQNIVAQQISKNLGVSSQVADDMLNRVHRGRPSENPQDKNKPRPIYANMYKWQDCEEIIDVFRSLNIKGKSSVRAGYLYGPRTTIRRNLALMERKKLREAGTIISGYISYPARLMGKIPGRENYILIKDFSTEEVTLRSNNDTRGD